MGTVLVNLSIFTMLTVVYVAAAKITAEESDFSPSPAPVPAVGMDAGAGFQLTQSGAFLLFCLILCYLYLTDSLFANPDPDSFAAFADDSDQNLFADIINTSLQEDCFPSEMGLNNQILFGIDVPLTSSVLLHSENRGEITTDEPLQDKQMQSVHVNEITVLHQNYSQPRDKSKEKDYCRISLGDLQQQFGKKRNDAAESLGENRGEITTEPPDEPLQDKQMQIVHVNETTVLHQNYSRPRGKSKEKDYCRISLGDLQQQFGKKRNDAAESLGVSPSTFKRCCRANGLAKWSCKLKVQPHTTPTLTQRVVESMATFQSDNTMSLKVSYNGVNVRFPLILSSGKNDLEAEVETRFGIQIGSFSIMYEDEDKDWILITCDLDLHHGMHILKNKGITTMKINLVNQIECDRIPNSNA
nr:PREDICTED: protein NLP5-like isoform X1 [Nicotiana tabacum]